MDTKEKNGSQTRRKKTGTSPAQERTPRRTGSPAPRAKAPRAQTGEPRRRRTREPRPPKTVPEVVYTPPKPFSRNRLLLRLASIVAVVLALTFGISIFFKVQKVEVTGAEKYTAWDVREASGIREGDNLLTFGKNQARVRIMGSLPYVKSVRIGIKLPDTVNIEIEELKVVYAIRDQAGGWWLITSEGLVVEPADSATAGQYTQIKGVQLASPAANQQAVAAETAAIPDPTGESTPVTVLGSERLSAALSIVQYLEQNGIIGQTSSVDVSDMSQLELWYGIQYQVLLGTPTQLGYKVSCMKKAIDQIGDHGAGVLDVSFTIQTGEDDTERVIYEPFT